MRDDKKKEFRLRAMADVTDDEGRDPPTSPPQLRQPSGIQPTPQLRPPPGPQSLPSLPHSLRIFYLLAFGGLLFIRFLGSQIPSRPYSKALPSVTEVTSVYQNLSLPTNGMEEAIMGCRFSKDKCCRLPLPPRLSTKLLLPYPINVSAHKAVLDHTGWDTDEQLNLLFKHQKLVSSALSDARDTMEWLNQDLASMFSKNKFEKSSISNAINFSLILIDRVVEETNRLVALHANMDASYHTVDIYAADALKYDRMTSVQEFPVKFQPSTLHFFNLDFHGWYGAPWKQKVKRREEVRLGLAVFTRDSENSQQLKRLFEEFQSVTQRCATEISAIDRPNISGKVWERIWSCYKASNIGKYWIELFESAEGEEEALDLELTTGWCRI